MVVMVKLMIDDIQPMNVFMCELPIYIFGAAFG